MQKLVNNAYIQRVCCAHFWSAVDKLGSYTLSCTMAAYKRRLSKWWRSRKAWSFLRGGSIGLRSAMRSNEYKRTQARHILQRTFFTYTAHARLLGLLPQFQVILAVGRHLVWLIYGCSEDSGHTFRVVSPAFVSLWQSDTKLSRPWRRGK